MERSGEAHPTTLVRAKQSRGSPIPPPTRAAAPASLREYPCSVCTPAPASQILHLVHFSTTPMLLPYKEEYRLRKETVERPHQRPKAGKDAIKARLAVLSPTPQRLEYATANGS